MSSTNNHKSISKQGKLKRQIKKERFYCEGCKSYKVYEDDVHKALDEAKKDFPTDHTSDSNYDSFKAEEDFHDKVVAWFKKWFGEKP